MDRIVACDLDGTLLTPEGTLPEGTLGLVGRLFSAGTLFVPASGRQLPDILRLFAPVRDEIAVIAENGALVWADGEIVYTDPVPAGELGGALSAIRGTEGLYPVLCCEGCAFYEDGDEGLRAEVEASYTSFERVPDLSSVTGETEALKISVWDPAGAEGHGAPALAAALPRLRVTVSGGDWLDVSAPSADKGEALKVLMGRLGVRRDGCVGFGNEMNDLGMLELCGEAYAVADASPRLRERIKNVIRYDAGEGVLEKLEGFL